MCVYLCARAALVCVCVCICLCVYVCVCADSRTHSHLPLLPTSGLASAHRAGAKNIKTAVELLHATRIGHGVGARNNPELQTMLKESGVAIEICPSSNIHTGCITSVSDHPARELYDAGITLCPCADNTLLSATTTQRENELVQKKCGFSTSEMAGIAKSAFTAAFDFTQKVPE